MTSSSAAVPDLSVIISTRNRRDQLLTALASVWMQTARIEVLVYDDGSEDDTAEAVRAAFPQTRVFRSPERLGMIVQRNRGARDARAPHFAIFDDDAEFLSPDTLQHALDDFDHERIGAVALPMIDLGKELVLRNRAPDDAGRYVTDTFPGGASLLAREPFLALGGYREQLFNRGEDSEYARRMLKHGRVVRIGTAPEVHHHGSASRQLDEDVYVQARAQVLQTAWTLPWRTAPRRLALSVGHGARHGHPVAAVRGLAAGTAAAARTRSMRDPLPAPLAALLRQMESERLRLRYRMRLEDLEPHLP